MNVVRMNVKQHSIDSLRAIEVDNGIIAISIFPELGGKLGSLEDLRTGKQWLWRSDRIALARQPWGVSYIKEADSGGWDECFPTVAPCIYPLGSRRGTSLPDHGDVWSQVWAVRVEQDADAVSIQGRCEAVTLPCDFMRTITLRNESATLEMQYEVRNRGSEEIAFIWSAHPLFRIEPGMSLEFPRSARFNLYSATPTTRVPGRTNLHWPFAVDNGTRRIALDTLPDRDAGIAFKIWSEPLHEGWARLVAAGGALRFSFDVREVPQIALWLNAGGWSGIGGEPYYNLALEPCIGAQDSLEEAVLQHKQYAVLRAGESRRWSLGIELGAT